MGNTRSARDRVRVHMNVLVAAAVVTTATAATDCGYGVVDPLPPPSSCPGLTGLLITAAAWVDDGAGGTELEFIVSRPGNRTDIVFEDWRTAAGQKITAQADASGFTLRLKVDAAATNAIFDVDVHCTGDDGVATTLRFEATVTSMRSAGTSAKVDVYELL